MTKSTAERLAAMPQAEREALLGEYTPEQQQALVHDWSFWGRPEQQEPDGDWDVWLALAGRGWGKTESGAQWVKRRVKEGARSIALVAETQKDLEEVMVKRLLSIYPEGEKPDVRYKPVRVAWPCGAEALGYVGTEPEQLRGPEFDTALVDELAKYRYQRETWDMLQFCMRAGSKPRTMITTTPRPTELIKSLVAGKEGKVHVTRGNTADNKANLAPSFVTKIYARHEGTRLGRQELGGEILGDLPGALWSDSIFETHRVSEEPDVLRRIVVSIDPAVTNTGDSDEHGIVVCAVDDAGKGYVLEDGSRSGTPLDWARRAIALYHKYEADAIVIEKNQGGDMCRNTITSVDPNIRVVDVWATKGKHLRAEPIAALYEQGRIAHVGNMPALEQQLSQFTTAGYEGTGSPDRADALVHGMTELFDLVTRKRMTNILKYKMTPGARL